jgi:hypothetical protein
VGAVAAIGEAMIMALVDVHSFEIRNVALWVDGAGALPIEIQTDRSAILIEPRSVSGKAIGCKACGRVSHNPNDVANRYCGHCHEFLDSKAAPQ